MKASLAAAAFTALLAGCANPINDHTWARYTREGHVAQERGQLQVAEEAHRRAVINARIGHLGPEREATALYNLGRVKRDLCKLGEAREALQGALELREGNKDTPPMYLTGNIFELAQLHYDEGRFAEAVSLMDRGFPLLDKANGAVRDPAGYVHMALEYSDALQRVGRSTDAETLKSRASSLAVSSGVDLQRKPNRPPFNYRPCR